LILLQKVAIFEKNYCKQRCNYTFVSLIKHYNVIIFFYYVIIHLLQCNNYTFLQYNYMFDTM